MSLKTNPFTLNPIEDVEFLIGRDDFLISIKEDYISNLESFILVGGRRTGKTSLLKSLCNENQPDTDYLYWDVSSTEGDSWDFLNSCYPLSSRIIRICFLIRPMIFLNVITKKTEIRGN